MDQEGRTNDWKGLLRKLRRVAAHLTCWGISEEETDIESISARTATGITIQLFGPKALTIVKGLLEGCRMSCESSLARENSRQFLTEIYF